MLKFLLNKPFCSSLFIWAPILIIPLLYTTSTIDANMHIRFVALSLFLLALCGFYYFLMKQNIYSNFQNDTIFILFFLYAVFSIPGCFLSPYLSGDSIFEWTKIILLPLLVFMMVVVFSSYNNLIYDLSKAATLLSVLVISYGVYQFYLLASTAGITHYGLYAVNSAFAHKNIFSEMLFMMLPFALYCFFSLNKFWRWMGLLCAFLSMILIVALMTRAVWMAFACGGVAVLIFYLFRGIRTKTILINRKIIIAVVSMAVIFSIAAAYLYFHKDNAFSKQVSNIFNFQYGSAKERIVLWKNSLKIFKDYPLFGAGLGNWKIEILKYGSSGLVSENNTTFYQRPHNDFIWILSEQGIFSFLIYLLIIGTIFYKIGKIIMHTTSRDERIFFYLLFGGFTGYCVFSLFSFPKERAEHLLFSSFIIAAVLIYKQKSIKIPDNKTTNGFSSSLLLFIVLAAMLSLAVSAARLRSEKNLALAFQARQNGDWRTMIHELDLAESFFYRIDPVSTPLRWYRGLANFNLNNTQDALYDFKLAYSYSPYHVHVLNNLGTCYEMAGNHSEAINYFEKTVELSSTFEEAKFNLIAAEYNSGDVKKAYEELRNNNFEHTQDKYNKFLNLALVSVIHKMKDTTDDRTKNDFDRILNTKGWLHKIHYKSLEEKRPLEKQFMLDLIYVFEIMEKDTTEANRLKNKFSIILK